MFVTDEKGAVHALDLSTGASAWKQDQFAGRGTGRPRVMREYVVVGDVEGYETTSCARMTEVWSGACVRNRVQSSRIFSLRAVISSCRRRMEEFTPWAFNNGVAVA